MHKLIKTTSTHLNEIHDFTCYAGISGLRSFSDGKIDGGQLNVSGRNWVDATSLEERKYNLGGAEKRWKL